MAEPVEQPGPVALAEEAAHLLRQAPLETLLCHWIGSVPFALGLLVCWTQWTHPPVPDAVCAAEALALALLLLWMNCWRSVAAGRLYRQWSGAPERPWTAARVWRLAAGQALFGAAKLVVLPLALAAVFPFAHVVAFFRNASVLGDREELDPLELASRARRLAARDPLQCWLLQLLLLVLSLAAMLNAAVTLMVIPQLLKMLTGIESAFTRGGGQFIASRLFLFVTMGATWLLFDPFVVAVYCVRCFRGEAVETGEDVRAGLRRIRAAAAVLLLVAVAGRAEAVKPAELRESVRKTMQAPEYNWRIPPPPESEAQMPWIVRATDRAIEAVGKAVKWVFRQIDRLLRWIFGGLGLEPMAAGGEAPARALHWSVWAALGVAAALAAWVVWRSRSTRRKKPAAGVPAPLPVHLEDEGLAADRLPEDAWLEMAERCLAEGQVRLALRAFYLANLAWLGRQEFLRIEAGKTNREFELELRRRARRQAEARELFSANVRAFERVWYGLHDAAADDARELRRRAERMKTLLRPEVAA
jgi:hypothetical protein